MQGIFGKVFDIFLIAYEKSKKSIKKLLPQKLRNIDTLSQNPAFSKLDLSPRPPSRLQIDKMPEKCIFTGSCNNKKKAVTLSQSKKAKKREQYILLFITSNFN